MANEYKLSYTASEVDAKLGKVNELETSVANLSEQMDDLTVEVAVASGNINTSEYEIGFINSDGSLKSYGDCFRSADFVPVIGGKTIYFVRGLTSATLGGNTQVFIYVAEYDSNKNFINGSYTSLYNVESWNNTDVTTRYALNENTCYIKVCNTHKDVPLDEIGVAIYYLEGNTPKTEYEAPSSTETVINGEKVYKDGKPLFIPTKMSQLEKDVVLEKPTILFVFDNGRNYDNRAEILENYGFRGTFCANYHNESDLKKFVNKGHDVAIYTGGTDNEGNTPPTVFTGDEVYQDWYNFLKTRTDNLAEVGYYYPTMLGCANLKGSENIFNIAKKLGYKYVACVAKLVSAETWVEDMNVEYYSISTNGIDNMALCHKGIGDIATTYEDVIQDAIANKQVLSLFTHNVEDTVTSDINISTSLFTSVVECVKEHYDNGEIDVLTVREFYNKYHQEDGCNMDFRRTMSLLMDLKLAEQ